MACIGHNSLQICFNERLISSQSSETELGLSGGRREWETGAYLDVPIHR